jgi:hypothetical protein
MLTRILWDKSSFKRKYSETMSSRRIIINTVSFFIIKKKGCIGSRSLSIYMFGIQYGLAFIGNVGCDLGDCIVLPLFGSSDVFLDIE